MKRALKNCWTYRACPAHWALAQPDLLAKRTICLFLNLSRTQPFSFTVDMGLGQLEAQDFKKQ